MDKLNKLWPVILTVAVIAIVLMLYQFLRLRLDAPDFASIENVSEKKATFLEYFDHSAMQLNNKIKSDRKRIVKLASGGPIDPTQVNWLKTKAAQYELTDDISPALIERMLDRIDVLPPALVLAQAALESGWGSSRFAMEGNNFFGQKCFYEGCGIAPRDRAPGQKFEMMVFDTPFESVNAYMYNLNTHSAYADLRNLRVRLRKSGTPLTGQALVEGLGSYSEEGAEYLKQLRSIMRANRLDETYPVDRKPPGPEDPKIFDSPEPALARLSGPRHEAKTIKPAKTQSPFMPHS